MNIRELIKSISKKVLFIILGILALAVILYFVWQNSKYSIVRDKLNSTVAKQTDSLYTVKYDSLHFDAATGQAFIKNIHIGPDTDIIKKTKLSDLPYILLDIKISSLKVNGVQTDKALLGSQMVGDSVVIDNPQLIVYFLKPLQKKTNINTEAANVYRDILGKLTRIKAAHVFLNNARITGVGYFDGGKVFDLDKGSIQLTDVLIDSSHNFDTTRTLFCKEIGLQIASFISYDNNRAKFRVKDLTYTGSYNLLSFGDIEANRFESENSDSSKFLHAIDFRLEGIDANEFVKNKNIILDSIKCKEITLYQPPFKNSNKKKGYNNDNNKKDTSGFTNVYSIEMKHLSFPNIDFIAQKSSKISVGNISILINGVKADDISDLMDAPLDHSHEAEISCDKISMDLSNGLYHFSLVKPTLNTLHKNLKIDAAIIQPILGEKAFAAKFKLQQDRYDVALKGIELRGIDMKTLINKEIIASDLIVNSTSAKIYRDLSKPLGDKSKVGNYPSQMLMKLKVPVIIDRASLPDAFIQYREHEKASDSTGQVTFFHSDIKISNITNDSVTISKNPRTVMSFNTKILDVIPVKGSFTFFLNKNDGQFNAMGNVSGFDAMALNKVSIPMALVRISQGTIHSIDFNFTGDDHKAEGSFVMKYDDFKVDILQKDDDSKKVSKKGFTTFLANTLVKNNNPNNGNLRTETPESDRDDRKSFFNLVWKTLFKGMKKTLGLP